MSLNWKNTEDQKLFEEAGLVEFDDFWNIETSNAKGLELESKRVHKCKKGNINRQTVRISLAGNNYFLKRTSGSSFTCIVREFEALSIIEKFGLTASDYSIYSFDTASKRGFIIFKELLGYAPFKEIYNGHAPSDIIDEFNKKKDELLKILFESFNKFRDSKYFYPDWRDKHIFFDPFKMDIALIDLERFIHVSELPAIYRFPFFARYKRRQELKTLSKALRLAPSKSTP